MRKLEVSRKELVTAENSKLTLVYSVTIDDFKDAFSTVELENYGTSVAILESGEEECVRRITPNMSKIFSLADALAAGTVTPLSLRDVINDYLSRD